MPQCGRMFNCPSRSVPEKHVAPGVKGSVLGLVDPVSVYCDWVR